MKVALVTDVYSQLSGVSTHVDLLATALRAKGVDVTVYTGTGSSKKYKVVNCPKLPFPFAKTYEIVFPPKKMDADVLHIHTPYVLGQAAMNSRKPRIVTAHTMANNVFPGKLSFLHPLTWNYLVHFYNRADKRICHTPRAKHIFQSHGLKDAAVLSAGIDLAFYSKGNAKAFRKKYKINRPFVLTTNRLSYEKRPELVLKACKELNLPIVLTSDGPLRKHLEREYKKAVFLGKIPREDLRNAYSAASVFVLPSAPDVEGEGLGVLEAMACKTPTLSSNVPFIKDGKNGILFHEYDDLKEKLKLLWKNKKLQQKLSKEGFKTAKKEDIRKLVKKYIALYRSLI